MHTISDGVAVWPGVAKPVELSPSERLVAGMGLVVLKVVASLVITHYLLDSQVEDNSGNVFLYQFSIESQAAKMLWLCRIFTIT